MSCAAKLQHHFHASGTEHFSKALGPPGGVAKVASAPPGPAHRPTEVPHERDGADTSDRVAPVPCPADRGTNRGRRGSRPDPRGHPGVGYSVDPDVAVLLASELVTNAITHEAGETITLAIRCSRSRLRVDVYDTSRLLPMAEGEPADTETGRGWCWSPLCRPIGALSHPRGQSRIFHARVPARTRRQRRTGRRTLFRRGGGEPQPPRRFTAPANRACGSRGAAGRASPGPAESPRRDGAQG